VIARRIIEGGPCPTVDALPSPLLYGRRRSIVDVSGAVVGQALEIGPDQGFVGRWEASAFAVIELPGQHEDEVAIGPAVPKTIR
jgi:hypothetical protein